MITFTKQTTSEDEDTIESTGAKIRGLGFNGDLIVYRNQVDVALSVIAIASLKINDIAHAQDKDGKFVVIGTHSYEEGQKLREQVNKMRETMGPFFGVTPEEPKEEQKAAPVTSAPRKALNP